MNSKAEKLLVVESDDALREGIAAVLSNAGYEVSTDDQGGMRTVLAFDPDAVLLGADPTRLDCSDLLSQIKGSEHTQDIRVVILSPGGSAERIQGMGLGADDVLSVPFDRHELLSRVRSQLRNRHLAREIRERLRLAEENRNDTRQVVTAVNEERRTLRAGSLAIIAVLIVGALVSLLFYRRTQEQNTRVYAAVTRLQAGVLTQQELMERSRQDQKELQRAPSPASDPQELRLVPRGEELRAQISTSKTENAPALQHQITEAESRLQKLETEVRFAQTVIQSYEPSVCLIHVTVAFRDPATGLRLHFVGLTSNGAPATDEDNNLLLSLTGPGPEVHLDAFGTGFLASASGEILTNHHVVEPWWHSDELKQILDQGVEPLVTDMTVYFPGVPHGIAVKTNRISSAADVAVVKGNVSELGIKQVALAEGGSSAVSGGPVVLLGYPTALDAILARADAQTVQAIATASKGDPKRAMEELARRRLIRPITTQGHIGDVLADKIVYDAQTALGGSGGPLFNGEGKVIGINFAFLPEFGGSNFAIPVDYGKSLLKP
jgi:DNA-binding response OmpR family regulator/S1-C subfamily serine protease